MNNLNNLNIAYENHPSFRFSEDPYGVESARVDAFNRLYKKISSGRFDDKIIKSANQEIKIIFAEMRCQVVELEEEYFLNELEFEVLELLKKEGQFYKERERKKNRIFPQSSAQLALLKEQRHLFGRLNQDKVKKIWEIIRPSVDIFRKNVGAGRLSREDLSTNDGSITSPIVKILNSEFKKNGVLNAISAYMGFSYEVGGMAIELSVPQSNWWGDKYKNAMSPKTVYAHLDEYIKYPKAIVYLTHVGIQNGPTSCYPGAYELLNINSLQELIGRVVCNVGVRPNSKLKAYYQAEYHQPMSAEKFRRHFMRLPRLLRFHSHFGWDINSGSAEEEFLVANERYMLGDEGTFIVFDGAKLLHRGGMVTEGERIALQVMFTPSRTVSELIKSLPHRVTQKIEHIAGRLVK